MTTRQNTSAKQTTTTTRNGANSPFSSSVVLCIIVIAIIVATDNTKNLQNSVQATQRSATIVEPTQHTKVEVSSTPSPVFGVMGDTNAAVSADAQLVELLQNTIEETPPLLAGLAFPQAQDLLTNHQLEVIRALTAGDKESMVAEGEWFRRAVAENPDLVGPSYQTLVQGMDATARQSISRGAIPFIANTIFALQALGDKNSPIEAVQLPYKTAEMLFTDAAAELKKLATVEVSAQSENAAQAESNPKLNVDNNSTGKDNTGTQAEAGGNGKPTQTEFFLNPPKFSVGVVASPIPVLWTIRNIWDAVTSGTFSLGSVETTSTMYVVDVTTEDPQGASWLGIEDPKLTLNYIYMSTDPTAIPFEGPPSKTWPIINGQPVGAWHGYDSQGSYWFGAISLWMGFAPFRKGDVVEARNIAGVMSLQSFSNP